MISIDTTAVKIAAMLTAAEAFDAAILELRESSEKFLCAYDTSPLLEIESALSIVSVANMNKRQSGTPVASVSVKDGW